LKSSSAASGRSWVARALGDGARRLRLAMYASFAALAVGILAQSLSTLRLEELRRVNGRAQELAGEQRTLVQRAGRAAARMLAQPAAREAHAQELQDLVRRSHAESVHLDEVLAHLTWRAQADLDLLTVVQTWTDARTELWLRAERLQLISADSDQLDIIFSSDAVQAATEAAMTAAQRLSAALVDAGELRAQQLHNQVSGGLFGLLLLLLALSLLVVEPTVRSVRRRAVRLREQAGELRRLALVAEHTAALVVISDRDDRVVWANEALVKATGIPLHVSRGKRPGELLAGAPIDPDVMRRVGLALSQGKSVRNEWHLHTPTGMELWLDVDLYPLQGEDGELEGFVRVCLDITSRVKQQAKQQALWAALPTGVVVQDKTGMIVESNPAAERLLGLTAEQLLGRSSVDPRWRAVRDDGSAYPGSEHPAMRTLATGLALSNEVMGIQLPGGEERWLLINTEPQRDKEGQLSGVVACFSDITESRSLQARLSDSARTDALTGLPNRAVVMERLQAAIAQAHSQRDYGFAVLFMDFDRFKQVNDSLGHAAGDELLRQLARRLERSVRLGDAVSRVASGDAATARVPTAARLGGDEFLVVLEDVSDVGAVQAVAQRLLQELAEPYLIRGVPLQSSVSIGVVMCPDPNAGAALPATAEEVLRNADTAMYEAKRAGRGRWVIFDDSMQQRVQHTLAIENDLRRALKDDELFVVYQPVVDLKTRQLLAVEALVRWRHPQRGLINPVEFIGVAEQCGLIDAVGGVVLRQACTQFMQWQRSLGERAPRSIAVNLSRAQLDRASLVDDITAILQSTGMQPHQLQLEVTESLAAQDERMLDMLRQIKRLGVRLALDDFGTGYSSLACLHQMPVDTVKVDRSFVQHAEGAEYHRVLIEATIRVARTLGMTTVAEGIETDSQAALMQKLACDRGQGYLFSRPLEADALAAWARSQPAVPAAVSTAVQPAELVSAGAH
jgi:diguanylate cyclase (GGDEF)-like protein/PAS domain S-box-containing protein